MAETDIEVRDPSLQRAANRHVPAEKYSNRAGRRWLQLTRSDRVTSQLAVNGFAADI
jgi:hypothetical protein